MSVPLSRPRLEASFRMIAARERRAVRSSSLTLMELPAFCPRRRRHCAMQLPPGEVLVEQLGKLFGHDAGKLLCVGHRHGAPVVAGDVMADANGEKFHRGVGLDFFDHLTKMALQI